jgi:hypothetical protein
MWRFKGAKRKAERGIKGIIGIFFFHYAGSKRTAAQTACERSLPEKP